MHHWFCELGRPGQLPGRFFLGTMFRLLPGISDKVPLQNGARWSVTAGTDREGESSDRVLAAQGQCETTASGRLGLGGECNFFGLGNVLAYGNSETRPNERTGNNGSD